MIIAGTGHRPNKILVDGKPAYDKKPYEILVNFAQEILLEEFWSLTPPPMSSHGLISGMAIGWDQALAEAAVRLGLPFSAYIPFEGQESIWPAHSQQRYRELLRLAANVVVVAPGEYVQWKLHARNQAMIRDSDKILALWDGTPGGTQSCLRAVPKYKPIRNVWSLWKIYLQERPIGVVE